MDNWSEIKSSAYHEAGHLVAAVTLGLPLCEGGMRIDLRGGGLSRYCIRKPGDPCSTSEGDLQRKNTITSLYAGQIAQTKFLPYLDDPSCWQEDDKLIDKLVREIAAPYSGTAKVQLSNTAKAIIDEKWALVTGLAELLWDRPVTSMSEEEFAVGWSKSKERREKFLTTFEVQSYFLINNINCKVC